MRKLNFLIGALGGVFGGYLLSNKPLRKKLLEAKDASSAAKILGREFQRSGKEVAKEAKEWLESDPVQEKVDEWKRCLSGEASRLKKQAGRTASRWGKVARRKAARTYERAKETIEMKLP